jgi:hypothetical protein
MALRCYREIKPIALTLRTECLKYKCILKGAGTRECLRDWGIPEVANEEKSKFEDPCPSVTKVNHGAPKIKLVVLFNKILNENESLMGKGVMVIKDGKFILWKAKEDDMCTIDEEYKADYGPILKFSIKELHWLCFPGTFCNAKDLLATMQWKYDKDKFSKLKTFVKAYKVWSMKQKGYTEDMEEFIVSNRNPALSFLETTLIEPFYYTHTKNVKATLARI